MANQYLRYFSLIAATDAGAGIELADFAVKFVVHHSTYTYPHTADVYIYNLSSATQSQLAKEFTKIQIMAGYKGNYGVIFQGAIKQVQVGRESATDGFTHIFAADGDALHNFGIVHTNTPAGYTQQQVWATLAGAAAPYNPSAPLMETPAEKRSPRGKVMYGHLRDYLRDWANTNGQLVTVDNGMLTAMPLLAFKPGDAVVLNENTGMVGIPEQTEAGITVTSLLNPAIMWGTRIQLNNDEITRNLINNVTAPRHTAGLPLPIKVAPLNDQGHGTDGFYKALSVDHVGETRGNSWYTQIICISLDPTAFITGATTGLGVGLDGSPSKPLPH